MTPVAGRGVSATDTGVVSDVPGQTCRSVRSVVFDVGETLLDDTRDWGRWTEWLGDPPHAFSAVLGAVTATGRDNAEVFDYFRARLDLEGERCRRECAGFGEEITENDLYGDVRPALSVLRRAGVWVEVASNQTAKAARMLGGVRITRRCHRHIW